MRIGRQVITWGLGDLLFINDVFPERLRGVLLQEDRWNI